jgi:hypothetical protein
MPKNLTVIFVIIGLATLTFFFGYRLGFRDTYNSSAETIDFQNSDFGDPNTLTPIKIKAVLGPQPQSDTSDYTRGIMMINEQKDRTDIRILLKNIPTSIQVAEDKKNNIPAKKIAFPQSLRVELATTNQINRTLAFNEISTLNLNPPVNNTYTGELNLSLQDKNIKLNEGAFLMFFDATNASENLYEIQLKDYPNLDFNKNKPFLWVYLQS